MTTNPGPSDGELMARLAAGRGEAEPALRVLYDRYAASLMTFAYHLTWDRSAAEDAVQETFLRLWRAAWRFRPGARLEPWLFGIARNAAVDAGARARGKDRGTPRTDDLSALAEPAAALPSSGPDAELAVAVQSAIDRLPERLRMAFVLVRLGGRSQEDAAALLDVPVGTIKSRVAAAEALLRTRLGRFA